MTEPPIPSLTQELWWNKFMSGRERSTHCLQLIQAFRGLRQEPAEGIIRALISQHEALRYSFRKTPERLTAVINDPASFIVEHEVAVVPRTERDVWIWASVQQFTASVLPVDGLWLTAAKLFMTGPSSGVAVLLVHHIVADGTSMELLRHELADRLACPATRSSTRRYSPVRLQFSDYAAWERARLTPQTVSELSAYWQRWLTELPPLLLPGTRTPLIWGPGRRVTHRFELAKSTIVELRRISAEHRRTPFLVMLATFALTLAQWSGQRRFGLWSVADGRGYDDSSRFASTVGLLVHMDPIGIDLEGGLSLQSALPRIWAACQNARRRRFPLNDCYPGLRERDLQGKLGATVNYIRFCAPTKQGTPPATRQESRFGIDSLQPINLRVLDYLTAVSLKLEFNDAVLPDHEQQAILVAFQDTLDEVTRGTCGASATAATAAAQSASGE